MKQELIDQKILEIRSGKARMVPNPPEFQTRHIENIRLFKQSEFEAMKHYVSLKGTRMNFLVRYLEKRST